MFPPTARLLRAFYLFRYDGIAQGRRIGIDKNWEKKAGRRKKNLGGPVSEGAWPQA